MQTKKQKQKKNKLSRIHQTDKTKKLNFHLQDLGFESMGRPP